MKLHIINDIHADVCPYNMNIEFFSKEVDAIVLSGDYSNTIYHLKNVVAECQKYKIPMIYVPGNHEFYNYCMQTTKEYIEHLSKKYSYFKPLQLVDIDGNPNIRTYVDEIHKVAFIGDTLWTDYDLFCSKDKSKEICRTGMKEMEFIAKYHQSLFFNKGASPLITPDYLEKLCDTGCKIINKLAYMYKSRGYKVVVLSHHAPHMNSIRADYRCNAISPAFGSNLLDKKISTANIDLWCHGHVHQFYDYFVNNTRVICNPRGYISYEYVEETYFKPQLIVQV